MENKQIKIILKIIVCILLVTMLIVASCTFAEIKRECSFSKGVYDSARDLFVKVDDRADSDMEISPVEVDFEELKKKCPDIEGWLYCPQTAIDYPVVLGDDCEWYLSHHYDDTEGRSGALFVDCYNHSGFTDYNTIIYGHHMYDGSMFADVAKYSSQSFFDEHPYIYLNTPDTNYRLEVFSAYLTKADNQMIYVYDVNDADLRQEYLEYLKGQSKISSDVTIGPNDRLISFYTCAYWFGNARFIVVAKMVPVQ